MQNWKQAYQLAKFELKASKLSFLFILIAILFITLLLFMFNDMYRGSLNNNYWSDLPLFTFPLLAHIFMPKYFRIQKLNGDLYVAPPVMQLLQLPVKKDVISKSRIIIHFVYFAWFAVLFFFALYLTSSRLQENISFGIFLIFTFALFALGTTILSTLPTGDFGGRFTTWKMVLYTVLLFGGFIILYFVYTKLFDYSIGYWILLASKKAPIITLIVSFVLLGTGPHFAHQYNLKQTNKVDYL